MADYNILSKIISDDEYHIKKFVQNNKQKINKTDSWGLSYLMSACRLGSTNVINLLIKSGSKLNMEDNEGNTPLHYAVKGKQHAVVLLMASRGANVQKCNAQGNSLLHLAVETGCKDLVKTVLQVTENKSVQINKQNVNGDTPLLLACQKGNTDVVQQLLQYKPHVNIRNKDDNTPLHWACRWGLKDVVEQLLLFDADVSVEDKYQYTPLHWACDGGHHEIVKQLLSWSGSKASTKVNINATDKDGVTTLHVACGLGYENVIKELQIPELKVNKQDIKYGNTPLHWACRSGHKNAVQQLLTSNPDVNLKNKDGNTPLHLAVLNEHYDVVSLLLSKDDVQIDIKNRKEETPLFLAISVGHFGILCKLISHKAAINAVDANGDNCLHHAVRKEEFHSEEETVDCLDNFCKMLNLKKERRLSGIIIAMYLGHSEGNFHHKNKLGETPMDLIENSDFKKKVKEYFPSLCLLCEINEPTVQFHPCEHTVICRKCCLNDEPKSCPKCKAVIISNTIPVNSDSKDEEDRKMLESLGKDLEKLANEFETTYKIQRKDETLKQMIYSFVSSYMSPRQVVNSGSSDTNNQQPYKSTAETLVKQADEFETKYKSQRKDTPLKLEVKHLHKVSKRLGNKWQQVGIFLGMKTIELEIIKCDYPFNFVEQSFQMLHTWFRTCDPEERTVKTLRDVLRETECFLALECLPQTE